MANTVYEIVTIKLSDGTELEIRPLTIKNLKKFTAVIKKLSELNVADSDEEAMDVFVEAGLVCMQQFKPDLAEDKERFEEVIEVPTLMKILEVAGGLKLNDPNFLMATDQDGMI
jgi:hypothetical protein